MRKYESLEYIRQLGLPTVLCREFTFYQQKEISDYFDFLTFLNLNVGFRTDHAAGSDAGTSLPLIPHGDKVTLLNAVKKHGSKFTYLLSEAPKKTGITLYGTVNILPGLNLFIAYNSLPGIPTCRHAIEDPRYQHGISYFTLHFAQSSLEYEHTPVWIQRLKNYIRSAWLRDGELIGKRIEFSLYHDYKRFVFWQVLKDNL